MPEIKVIDPLLQDVSKKLHVAAYCRVSSDSSDQLNSFIAQVKHYTEYINGNADWELADIYADEGLTGTRMDKREDFNRLLTDCRKGKVDRILVKSVSRFARNTEDCLMTVREIKALGISIYFEKEDIDTANLSNEMILSVSGTLAQEESVSISNNMRWSCQKRMQKGTYVASSVPYGYQLLNNALQIVDEEAEIVRYIFDSYLSGVGKKQIADRLNILSAPKHNGYEKWYIYTVNYILNNEKYTGNALLQKKYTTDTLPFIRKPNNGEKAKYYVHDSHPPIIDLATFESVKKLQLSKSICKRKAIESYPLTKKIKCGQCGYFYKRKAQNDKVFWVCYNHNKSIDNCPASQIPENEIYNAFTQMVNKLKLHHKTILIPLFDQIETMQAKSMGSQIKIYEIDKQIADLNEQNLVLARLKTKEYIDSADFMSQSSNINQKVNKLRSDRRKMLQADENDQTVSDLKALYKSFESMDGCMPEFDESLFESIINGVVAMSHTTLKFKLIGGLELTEEISYRGSRCRKQ